jgi:hypothetical protein
LLAKPTVAQVKGREEGIAERFPWVAEKWSPAVDIIPTQIFPYNARAGFSSV